MEDQVNETSADDRTFATVRTVAHAVAAARDYAHRHLAHGDHDAHAPGSGQVWRMKGTDIHQRLLARRTIGWITTDPADDCGATRVIDPDDLARDWEYVSCDHEHYCCRAHQIHVMPHRGCVLR